jgi:hypothetical protein
MRKIKFRAWAVASKEMFLPDEDNGWEILDGKLEPLPNTVLMQYTGLKADGVEIYEGDILQHPETGTIMAGRFIVKWIASSCAFRAWYGEIEGDSML